MHRAECCGLQDSARKAMGLDNLIKVQAPGVGAYGAGRDGKVA